MTRSNRRFAFCVAACLFGVSLLAKDKPNMVQPPIAQPVQPVSASSEAFKGKSRDLPNHPFLVSGLILKLEQGRMFNGDNLYLQVWNPTAGFSEFHPEDLTITNAENLQVTIGISFGGSIVPGYSELPVSHIAPKAYKAITYRSEETLTMPFKIYFEDKLLAEISE